MLHRNISVGIFEFNNHFNFPFSLMLERNQREEAVNMCNITKDTAAQQS